jgi:glycosyltransferase involved in cell wall biosynthesis
MARLCFVTFCLNEEKFLRYAINSWLQSDSVATVIVVEGAVRMLSKYATSDGLSKDKTADIVKQIQQQHTRGADVHYRAHGWAANKAELQNAGLDMATRIPGGNKWVMLAGGDEVYEKRDLARLAMVCESTNASILCPTFRHFWRRPDVVAVGSSWGVKMHRIYQMQSGIKFSNHAAPPFSGGGRRKQDLNDVVVYHYAGMQDKASIDAKLELYRQRDGHRLKVTDTWTDWQWGQRTQWTHGAGSAEIFADKHPSVIADDVWALMPKHNGRLLPLPTVPWEKKVKVGIVTDQYALKVAAVKQALEQVVRHFDVKLFAPSELEVGGVKSKPFDVRELQECGVSISASYVIMRDQCKMNIRLAVDKSGVRGYDAVVDRGDPSALVLEIAKLIAGREGGIPKGKRPAQRPSETFGVRALDRQIVPGRPIVISGGARGRAHVAQVGGLKGSTTLPIKIENKTKAEWVPGRHVIQAIWLDGSRANPIRDAPRASMLMPYAVNPGAVFMPPMSGMLKLSVDVIEAGRRRLGVGPIVPVRTVL